MIKGLALRTSEDLFIGGRVGNGGETKAAFDWAFIQFFRLDPNHLDRKFILLASLFKAFPGLDAINYFRWEFQ